MCRNGQLGDRGLQCPFIKQSNNIGNPLIIGSLNDNDVCCDRTVRCVGMWRDKLILQLSSRNYAIMPCLPNLHAPFVQSGKKPDPPGGVSMWMWPLVINKPSQNQTGSLILFPYRRDLVPCLEEILDKFVMFVKIPWYSWREFRSIDLKLEWPALMWLCRQVNATDAWRSGKPVSRS